MPSVTIDDVLQAVKARWDEDGILPTLVPGGLWHGRTKQDATYPHAEQMIEAGDREEFSGLAYLQPFTVTIQVRDAAASPATDAIHARMSTLLDRNALSIAGSGTRVVHVRPKAPRLTLEDKTREANNVLIAAATWEILVQADRG